MRLFVALWPGDALRERIHAVTRAAVAGATGRIIPLDDLHLTLAFLGQVDPARLPGIEAAIEAAAASHAPFTMELTRVGTFERARVLWLGGPATPELRGLIRDLNDRLGDCGFQLDRRRFQPHVSVVRGLELAEAEELGLGPLDEALGWPVDRMVLVRSYAKADGARYERLGEWPLSG